MPRPLSAIPGEKAVIAVLGAAVRDITYRGRLPRRGQFVNGPVRVTPGGDPVITAIHLAESGHSVRALVKVGADRDGDHIIDALKGKDAETLYRVREGKPVDTGFIIRDGRTAISIVLLEQDGERKFCHDPGTNAGFTQEEVMGNFEKSMEGVGWLHVAELGLLPSLWGEPIGNILVAAKGKGIVTSLDLSGDIKGDMQREVNPINVGQIRRALEHTDFLVSSRNELGPLSGLTSPYRIVQYYQSLFQVPVVGVTMGQKGVVFAGNDAQCFHCPASVVEGANTTGAGAIFKAMFIGSILRYRDGDIGKAMIEAGKDTAEVLKRRIEIA